jgi:HEAT repeat protein
MTPWAPYFLAVCILFGLAWIAVSAAVILNRVLYDLLRRSVRLAQTGAEAARFRTAASVVGSSRRIEATLARLPRPVIEHIAADSTTPRWQAQVFATYILERWESAPLVRAASTHKGEMEKWARIAALRILALGGERGIMDLLETAINDSDSDVAGAAVVLLGRMNDERAAYLLVEGLQRGTYTQSRIATQLDRFPRPIAHFLRPLLQDSNPAVRFWAATLLVRYAGGIEINKALASLVDDVNPGVRKAAVETLGKAGGPYAAQAAVHLIDDPVWYVRAHAARALGDLRRADLCHVVTPLLADREWWVRTAAKDSLQAMGRQVEREVLHYLDSSDVFARNGAAEVLQNIGIVDDLLIDTISDRRVDPGRIELIRKIMSAGGPGLMKAAIGRAEPNVASVVVELLERAA